MNRPYERSIEVLSDGELPTSPTQKFSPLKHPAASAAAHNQARKRVDIEILSDGEVDAATACSTHPKVSPSKMANFSGVPIPQPKATVIVGGEGMAPEKRKM